MHLAFVARPMAFKSRRPWAFTASMERNNGVLSSIHLPRCVTNEHGMRRVVPTMKGGAERSHTVKAAAVCVARRPPLGKDDPSVSPWKRRSYGNVAKAGLLASFELKSKSTRVSIFKAPKAPPTAPLPPRDGKNQCAKSVAPRALAHLNSASAMIFISSSGV